MIEESVEPTEMVKLDINKPMQERFLKGKVTLYTTKHKDSEYPYVGVVDGNDLVYEWNEYGEEKFGVTNIENTPPKESFHVHINEDGVCLEEYGDIINHDELDKDNVMLYCNPEEKVIHIRVVNEYSVVLIDENDKVLYDSSIPTSPIAPVTHEEQSREIQPLNLVGMYMNSFSNNK